MKRTNPKKKTENQPDDDENNRHQSGEEYWGEESPIDPGPPPPGATAEDWGSDNDVTTEAQTQLEVKNVALEYGGFTLHIGRLHATLTARVIFGLLATQLLLRYAL